LRQRIGKRPIKTKDPGCGSGAGVAIAQAALERFGGAVHIQAWPGGGTRVVAELPLFRMSMEKQNELHRLHIAG
jgi:signal transduction histidine kinase